MPIPAWLASMGQQAAGSVVGEALGMAIQPLKNKQQLKQAGRLQKLQIAGQKEMTEFNREQQMQMWRDTSYPAQMAMMKEAGLNPGLMYGMGGGGGQTASVTGGSVAPGASAETAKGGMGLNVMTAAQLELIKAQTRDLNATASNKENFEPKRIESEISLNNAQTGNTHADTRLKNIQYELDQFEMNFKNATRDDMMEQIKQLARKLGGEASSAIIEANIGTATEAKTIEAVGANLAQIYLRNEQIKAETKLTEEQQNEVVQAVKESIARVNNMMIQQYQRGIEINQEWAQQEIAKDLQKTLVKIAWIGAGSKVLGDIVEIAKDVVNPLKGVPRGTKPPEVRGFKGGNR